MDAGDQASSCDQGLSMDKLPERPAKPAALETAPMRADFQDRLQALREAAKTWGVQPDHPEGVFVSTMIGTQTGFAELALSLGEALYAIVREARATAEDELARQRVVTQQTRMMLDKASCAILGMEEGARLAIERIEIEKNQAVSGFLDSIVPDMVRGVRQALVIRERRYNHEAEWARAVGLGMLMLGLVLFGYGWGTWSDWGMASRVENIGAAIDRCQITSKWPDDKGKQLCELNDFLRN
jgi:hypothetical protein